MERLNYIDINGKLCPLCYNMRAAQQIADLKAPKKTDDLEAVNFNLQCLSILLQGGADYAARFNGVTDTPRYTLEDLQSYFTIADAVDIAEVINKTLQMGIGRQIETQEPKNAETAPAEQTA